MTGGSIEELNPDSTGCWLVSSICGSYTTLDLDDFTALRMPGDGGAMPLDGKELPIKFIEAYPCVGERWRLTFADGTGCG